MSEFPLRYQGGHIFLEVQGVLWLVDTGSPVSFGVLGTVDLGGHAFRFGQSYLGLTSETLSGHVGTACAGLLGADVLQQFELVLDLPNARAQVCFEEQPLDGDSTPLDMFMGIPIVAVEIKGVPVRMFFDTGAQISYLHNSQLLDSFPGAGLVADFYPGVGEFEVETHSVPVSLGTWRDTIRCGGLPGILEGTLAAADVGGILGNEVCLHRWLVYCPRRRVLLG